MQKLMYPVIIGCCFILVGVRLPSPKKEKVEWLTISEAQEKYAKEKRPILIDLYTNWCGWCKVMDKKTYSNKNVVEYISEKFYPVKMNAEQRSTIDFNGKTYNFNREYRTNELAIYFTHGQLAYPTTVIIPVNGGDPQPVSGYMKPAELEVFVKYFGEGNFEKMPFTDFQKTYKPSW